MLPQPEEHAASSPATHDEFTREERVTLLNLAHESILSALEHREISLDPPSPRFSEPRGAFTTIYLQGQLRGCVGYVLPVISLYRAVAETARAAAFEDTRFAPVTLAEAPVTRGFTQHPVAAQGHQAGGSRDWTPRAGGLVWRTPRIAFAAGAC